MGKRVTTWRLISTGNGHRKRLGEGVTSAKGRNYKRGMLCKSGRRLFKKRKVLQEREFVPEEKL